MITLRQNTVIPRQAQPKADDEVEVIKNDKRGKVPHLISTTPEYQRLGIDPVQILKDRAGEVLPTANVFHTQGKAIPRLNKDIPQQRRVSVGAKSNNFWIDNNDNVNVDSLQGLNPLQTQKVNVQQQAPQMQQANQEPQDEIISEDLIQPGQYILLIQGKTIASGDLESIEDTISSYYFNDTYDLKPEDFVVLKRMNIKIGVVIENGK